jgi:hypothetical protein
MEMTTYPKATKREAAFRVVVPMSGSLGGFNACGARLPFQTLSITGGVRPVTVQFTADEHNVRTWSPPV